MMELTRWKRERLAHHHAYFALLDRSFARWKKVALARRQRRQRVIAACCVGARFFQRLYWNQWRTVVADKRVAREQATRRLGSLCAKVNLRNCFDKWKLLRLAARRRRHLPFEYPAGKENAAQRLEVRGVALQATAAAPCDPNTPAPISSTPTGAICNVTIQRANSLARIVVQLTLRQYFDVWRRAARAVEKILTAQLSTRADAFRLGSSWRRWRHGLSVRTKNHTASRQAVFFFYFHLTKKSITLLNKFAFRQRRERGVTVAVSSRVRRRRMRAAFSLWRQRFDMKLVFSEWRSLLTDSSRRQSNAQLSVIEDIVESLGRRQLLHRFFTTWFDDFNRRCRSRAIARLVEGPISKIAVTQAFRHWYSWTARRKREETWIANKSQGQLFKVWRAWSDYTRAKELRKSQRRSAIRFWYYRTLRRAFQAFTLARERQRVAHISAEDFQRRRELDRLRRCLYNWSLWTSCQSRRRAALTLASEHHVMMLKRQSFRAFVKSCHQAQQRLQLARQRELECFQRALRNVFDRWRDFCAFERGRSHMLSRRLEAYRLARALTMKRSILLSLSDNAKSKMARRLQNAYARGHYASQLLRFSFSRWLSFVAETKWEHVFTYRANHFRAQRLKRRYLEQWKSKVAAIQGLRAKICCALHHWKLARERKSFAAWVRYTKEKRHQRERMHSALEFRHHAHVIDGLSRWATGANHLCQQRSVGTAKAQAMYTAQLWHKVRDIASHWRWITRQKKYRRTDHSSVEKHEPYRVRSFPRDTGTDVGSNISNTGRPRQTRTPPTKNQSHSPTPAISEFVLLPRNRPRPRKPLELILGDASDIIESHSQGSPYDALKSVTDQFGFQFPVEAMSTHHHPDVVDTGRLLQSSSHASSDAVTPPAVTAHLYSFDQLEQQLQRWQIQHERLKDLQRSLEDFRALLHHDYLEGNLSQQELGSIRARLQRMEELEQISRERWDKSRPEIILLAQRIKALRDEAALCA